MSYPMFACDHLDIVNPSYVGLQFAILDIHLCPEVQYVPSIANSVVQTSLHQLSWFCILIQYLLFYCKLTQSIAVSIALCVTFSFSTFYCFFLMMLTWLRRGDSLVLSVIVSLLYVKGSIVHLFDEVCSFYRIIFCYKQKKNEKWQSQTRLWDFKLFCKISHSDFF